MGDDQAFFDSFPIAVVQVFLCYAIVFFRIKFPVEHIFDAFDNFYFNIPVGVCHSMFRFMSWLNLWTLRKKKKLCVLSYLADRIPEDREFKEVLNGLHTFGDAATIRREMYDYFLIDRKQNGSLYTVKKDRLSVEALLEKYC